MDQRTGTVFITWNYAIEGIPGHYMSYWDALPDGDGFLEQGPNDPSLDLVLTWAGERADRIHLRPEWDVNTCYWAGVGEAPEDHPVLV